MEQHYDVGSRSFTRSFRIGGASDCCAASAGLAKGMSFASWSSSRADVRNCRPMRSGRLGEKAKQDSLERAHLAAYIRSVRSTMEGPKGGSDPVDKWHTTYLPINKRWKEYERHRRASGLPIIGSESLFRILWKESGISEEKAVGHAKCNRCGDLEVEREKYAGRMDEEGKRQLARVEKELMVHNAEHRGERNYAGELGPLIARSRLSQCTRPLCTALAPPLRISQSLRKHCANIARKHCACSHPLGALLAPSAEHCEAIIEPISSLFVVQRTGGSRGKTSPSSSRP